MGFNSAFKGLTYTVGCATKDDATTKECYNEQFLSIKSGRYNEREGISFIIEISVVIFTIECFSCTLDYLCFFIRKSLFIVFTRERWVMLFKLTRRVYKS